MALIDLSAKHMAINKTNARMVAMVGVASFVSVFCLVATQAVWSQTRYQARVISASQKANQQLAKNLQTFNDLVSAYNAFNSTPNNVIGGLTTGTGDNDGNNTKIILDALPANYDFPALATSIDKILTQHNLKVTTITGTDDQVAQQSNKASPNPQPVTIPFSFSIGNANYSSVQQLITALQASILPIQIDTLTISGGASSMTVTINAHTFYQPVKSLGITQKVVK